DAGVAAPLAPCLVLGDDQPVVIVVVPGGRVEVFVAGDDAGGAAGVVGLHDGDGDVLVEPVEDRVGVALRGPVHREAAQRVGLRRGGHPGTGQAVAVGVAHRQFGAGLAA